MLIVAFCFTLMDVELDNIRDQQGLFLRSIFRLFYEKYTAFNIAVSIEGEINSN